MGAITFNSVANDSFAGGVSWTSAVVSGGIATHTLSSTTGIYPGMLLSIINSGVIFLDNDAPQVKGRALVTEVTDGTHLKATTAAADGTYTPSTLGSLTTFPAMSLRGTTPTGSAGSAGNGTVTPADSTRGFYEMQITAADTGATNVGSGARGRAVGAVIHP
jgi:hypothetical protein